MPEIDTRSQINSAGQSTSEGRDITRVFDQFPSNIGEFLQQQDISQFYRPGFELAQLGVEATEGYWAEQRFQSELSRADFPKESEEINDENRPTIVWLGGLMTWKGIGEVGQQYNSLTPMAIKGPYAVVFEYFKRRGANVVPIFPKSGINTPDSIEENVRLAAEAIHIASETSDGPIEVAGHSMGVGEEYLLAAEYPDEARMVGHFYSGGFSLPLEVNSWVKGTFAAFRGGKELRIPTEMIEFLVARESQGVRSRMISWINNEDRIVRGPSPKDVVVKPVQAGHSSIFYSRGVLDEMWETTMQDMHN